MIIIIIMKKLMRQVYNAVTCIIILSPQAQSRRRENWS